MKARPATTKCCSGMLVFGVGDVGCQVIAEDCEPTALDLARTARAAAFGGAFSLWLHVWWGKLEQWGHRFVPIEKHGQMPNTLFKLFWDQTFSATLFNIGYIAAANSNKPEAIPQALQTQLPGQMLLHWKFWPGFHLVNFTVLPLHYRPIAMNVVKVGWTGLLSYRAHNTKEAYDQAAPLELPEMPQFPQFPAVVATVYADERKDPTL